MSKKLPPEQKAKAVAPLTKTQTEFIQIHLARGASPKIIRETMNRLSKDTREELFSKYHFPGMRAPGQEGRSWLNLAGTRELSSADVRRVYDALRKTPGGLNTSRKEALAEFKVNDARQRAIFQVEPNAQLTSSRKLHDLGFARRFGADREMIRKLEDAALVPGYFTEHGKFSRKDEDDESSEDSAQKTLDRIMTPRVDPKYYGLPPEDD